MSFQIEALGYEPFADYFSMSDTELSDKNIVRKIVDKSPCYPCRVSLEDGKIGETVILLNFEHQPRNSPFRSSHAIFVREGAKRARLNPGQVPYSITNRMISVRAFDSFGMMVLADVVSGDKVEECLQQYFVDEQVDYIQLHNAKPGCFAANVYRA